MAVGDKEGPLDLLRLQGLSDIHMGTESGISLEFRWSSAVGIES